MDAGRRTWEYPSVEEHDLAERDPLSLCPRLPLVHPGPQLLQHRVAYPPNPHTPRHQHSEPRPKIVCPSEGGEGNVRTEVMCDDVGLGRATPRPEVLLDVGQLVHREARPQVLVRVTVAQEVPQQQAEARRQALQQLCTPDGL